MRKPLISAVAVILLITPAFAITKPEPALDAARILIPQQTQTSTEAPSGPKPLRAYKDFDNAVNAVAYSPNGRLLAAGVMDGSILIYDALTGEQKFTFKAYKKRLYGLAFSPDSRYLASSAHEDEIFLWDMQKGEKYKELTGHSSVVYALAYDKTGRWMVSGSHDKTAILWDMATGSPAKTLSKHKHVVYAVAFSPDGKMIATGSHDRTVILWNATSGEPVRTLEGYPSSVQTLSFSPDGKFIAAGGADDSIYIWDVSSGAIKKMLKGHKSSVESIAYSPDGRTIVSGSRDRSIIIWNLETAQPSKTIGFVKKRRGEPDTGMSHTAAVNAIAISPDGRTMSSGGADRSLIVWDLSGAADSKVTTNAFEKGEFETSAEYKKRLEGLYVPYNTGIALLDYDADKGGFKTNLGGADVFIAVPMEVARELKNNPSGIYVEGMLGYHSPEMTELINGFLVSESLGIRLPIGRRVAGVKAGGASAAAAGTPGEPPQLSYRVVIEDANKNGVFEGGEKVAIEVMVKNTGKGNAIGVSALLEGEGVLFDILGKSKLIGTIPPGGESEAEFEGVLPNEFKAGNLNINVSVKEARGYSPTDVKSLTVAMRPADITKTSTVVSKLSDVDILPSQVKGYECKDCFAIIVGISKYRMSDAIPDVKYAKKDAEIVSSYLQTVGGLPKANIKLMTDDSATKADIESAIEEWLPRRVKPTSTVFVYYAGHGTPDPNTNQAYIVPYEGEAGYYTKLYPLKKLYETLNNLQVAQVMVMLDSCFSGSGERSIIPKGARPMTLSVENPVLAGKKLVVLAASKGNEISSDYEKAQHGLFTYYLLRGFKGDADTNSDGMVRVDELYNYVQSNVSSTALTELDREQNPVLLPGLENIKGSEFNVTRVK